MEILGLFDFLYDDDCAVCRRRDSVRVSGGGAFRVTEKHMKNTANPTGMRVSIQHSTGCAPK